MSENLSTKKFETTLRLHETQAQLNAMLDVFGDFLAEREGYSHSLSGIEAIHYFLVQKHNWFPSQVRALSWEDLNFLMSEEMREWSLPKEFRGLGKRTELET